VRPGVPRLYKTAFPNLGNVPHIAFGAKSVQGAAFDVTLWNPLEKPGPAWRFKTETLRRCTDPQDVVATRSLTSAGKHNQEQGMAVLETVKLPPGDAAREVMDELRNYSIHCANTPCLRGLVQDQQSREPVGLAGGRLPEAVGELLAAGRKDPALAEVLDEVRELIDWAEDFSAKPSSGVLLSPSAARSRLVIQFDDRFMARRRKSLTGYDASEGALYVLYYAVLALHPKSPRCLAVDNMDQSLNPRLAQHLMAAVCSWTARVHPEQQWLLTTHNPAVLDGLPLDEPDVRLFAVDRDTDGHTDVRGIDLATAVDKRPSSEWTLSRMWMNGLLGGVPNV